MDGRASLRINHGPLGALEHGIVRGGVLADRRLEPVSELSQEVTLRAERGDLLGLRFLFEQAPGNHHAQGHGGRAGHGRHAAPARGRVRG